MQTMKLMTELEQKIDYKFKNKNILLNAIHHPSSKIKNNTINQNEFERLEFLGDRIIGCIIAHNLYKIDKSDEGKLSARYHNLVSKEVIFDIANKISLKKYINFHHNRKQTNHQKTILSDACEAIIGAIFLDGGYTKAKQTINLLWKKHMMQKNTINHKSFLQEWTQKNKISSPIYKILSIKGNTNNPEFSISLILDDKKKNLLEKTIGTGNSKKIAEKDAAKKMLEILQKSTEIRL